MQGMFAPGSANDSATLLQAQAVPQAPTLAGLPDRFRKRARMAQKSERYVPRA
jgi:hypothetical protein